MEVVMVSSVSSQCERLLLQKREFKDFIAISMSCPSQLLGLTEDISAAHLGWGEAEGGKHVASLRQQMLHEKMMICGARATKQVGALQTAPAQKWGKQSQLESVMYASCGSEVTLGIKCLLEAVQRVAHRSWWQVSLCPLWVVLEGHSTCPGVEVSVVHMLLLTQEGNTNLVFHHLYRGIVLSIVVTGEELLLVLWFLVTVIRAHRCHRKVLINTLGWWSSISIPIKLGLWLSSWRNIMFLCYNRESELMWRVDMLSKFWTALSPEFCVCDM